MQSVVNIKHRKYPRKIASAEDLKSIRNDIVELIVRKNLPEIVWQGKKVTRVVQKKKSCSC